MALIISTNISSSGQLASNLASNNSKLKKSLARLSGGAKINSPADDAGGLAVSQKLQAALKRTDAVNNNVSNAVSYLQAQDGGLKIANQLLKRMAELRVRNDDVTRSDSDKANDETEFADLQAQLTSLDGEKFNSIALFGAGNLSVQTAEDGPSSTVNISQADLAESAGEVASAIGFNAVSVGAIATSIDSVATLRATNGAETNRMQFASELLTINRSNMEAATSGIIDVDIAGESTRFAQAKILIQSGVTIMAQANTTSQATRRLIE